MQTSFKVSNGEENSGPFSLAEIVAKLEKLEVVETDLIFIEDQDAWLAMNEFGPIKKRLEILEKLGKRPSVQQAKAALLKVAEEKEAREVTFNIEHGRLEFEQDFEQDQVEFFEQEEEQFEEEHSNDLSASVEEEEVNEVVEVIEEPIQEEVEEIFVDEEITQKIYVAPRTHELDGKRNFDLSHVRIVNGEAVLEISHTVSERIEIKLNDSDLHGVNIINAQEVIVHSGEAVELTATGSNIMAAGEEVRIEFVARDAFGNVDENYNRTMLIERRGNTRSQERIEMIAGHGEFIFKSIRAEKVQFDISELNGTESSLRTRHSIEVRAGRAVQIVVETPHDVKVGNAFKVVFRAVDQFGNFVNDFNGTLDLELVHASKKAKPQVTQTA
jgi:hypothetical protein